MMNLLVFCVVLSINVATTLSAKYKTPRCDGPGGTEPEFDYYLFVLQHPNGVCETGVCEICQVKSSYEQWTVHGLWPSIEGEFGPNYCGDPYQKFDLDSLWPLKKPLYRRWPGLCKEHGNSISFWEYQYCKHGTCAREESSIDTEVKYFSKVLELTETFDFEAILAGSGIVPHPDIGYDFSTINNAFVDALGVKPFMECDYGINDWDKQVLYQVSICLDKSFNAVNCDYSTYMRETRCYRSEEIYYI